MENVRNWVFEFDEEASEVIIFAVGQPRSSGSTNEYES